jgi:hypothetical protein
MSPGSCFQRFGATPCLYLQVVYAKITAFWNVTQYSVVEVEVHTTSEACCLLHVAFLLRLFFYPEDGSNMFLRKVC